MPGVTNSYETVFILSTKLGEDGIINKEAEGYYVLIDFTSVPAFTAELDRIYKITDGVLRSLIIKKEPEKAKKE